MFAIFIVLALIEVRTAVGNPTTDEVGLCGPQATVTLTDAGEGSSMVLNLKRSSLESVCELRIRAPASHFIHLQFLEANVDLHRAMRIGANHPPCMLHVYLPENEKEPTWSGNLCGIDYLPQVDLLTPNARLTWITPRGGFAGSTKGRQIVLTAIGTGDTCKKAGKYTCMKIGSEPYCISGHLLCDGHENCPKGSRMSDEDDAYCNSAHAWKMITANIAKMHQQANSNFREKFHDDFSSIDLQPINDIRKAIDWIDKKGIIEVTTKSSKGERTNTFLTDSPYWPWGYFLLGILGCGSVLMVCIFWECWITRVKTRIISRPPSPETSLRMISGYEDLQQPPAPPDYNDLDLPPSYTLLFPHKEEAAIARTDEAIELQSDDNQGTGESSQCVSTVV